MSGGGGRVVRIPRGLAFLINASPYIGVYQRRENLRFYGIEEDPEGAEDTWQVLMDFVQPGLGIDDASDIEFQRVHRISSFNQQAPKPRQIIARFLHYPDRERVMSNARKLNGRKFGISATCLKKSLIDGREKAKNWKTMRDTIETGKR